MNILYLSADAGIPIRGSKGAAVHIRSMCAAFNRLGHMVTVMTPRAGPPDGQEIAARVLHIPLPAIGGGAPGAGGDRDARLKSFRGPFLQAIQRELRENRYDFIYERHSLWSDAGAQTSRLSGLPLVLEVNAPLTEEAARYRSLSDPESAREIEAAQFRGASAVAVVSETLKAYVEERGARAGRVRVVPNGVDPSLFHPAVRGGSVHLKYGLRGKKVVGFAGRVRPWHDIDTLLESFARLLRRDPDYHLLLVGRMPEGFEDRLQELGLRQDVTLTGPVPHEAVPRHLAAMDVAVSCHVPLDDFYFSPLKLFEYMACGVPTVAADIGQPSAIVRPGESGELYRPGDPASLAEKIARLIENPAYARELAWNGASLVLENHTWKKNAQAAVSWVLPPPPFSPTANGGAQAPALPILDSKLRQRLYRATRADLAMSILKPWTRTKSKRAPFTSIQILKYKPGRRCVLRYNWRSRDGESQSLIGKVFRDRRGARYDKAQRILWANGFGDGDVRIPRSLGYSEKMRMQLQEASPGSTMNDLYRAGTDLSKLVPLAARGLVCLHEAAAALQPAAHDELLSHIGLYRLEDELASLRQTKARLAEFKPETSWETDRIHGHLARWGAALELPGQDSLVHRDFYYSQVLVAGERLTIIDLDLLAAGDEAIDIGNFTAHLHFLGLEVNDDFDALSLEAFQFKHVYQQSRPMPAAFWERVAFYEAATLFRLLRVVAARPQKSAVFMPLLERTGGRMVLP